MILVQSILAILLALGAIGLAVGGLAALGWFASVLLRFRAHRDEYVVLGLLSAAIIMLTWFIGMIMLKHLGFETLVALK